jgi:hypothetical protein
MPKGKAQADAKAQHTCKYVSILRRFATPPLGIRCIFEIGSRIIAVKVSSVIPNVNKSNLNLIDFYPAVPYVCGPDASISPGCLKVKR